MELWFERAPPPNFKAAVEIAGCYCQCGDRILFLKRHPRKPYGGTWGVPAGKMEAGEDPRMCVIRETAEETGLDISSSGLREIGALYCRIPQLDFTYHMFHMAFATIPKIDLALSEHTEFRWITDEEALRLPLIIGGLEALAHFRLSQNQA